MKVYTLVWGFQWLTCLMTVFYIKHSYENLCNSLSATSQWSETTAIQNAKYLLQNAKFPPFPVILITIHPNYDYYPSLNYCLLMMYFFLWLQGLMSTCVPDTIYLRLLNHNSHHNVWSSKSHHDLFYPEGKHFQLSCALEMLEHINVAYHSP